MNEYEEEKFLRNSKEIEELPEEVEEPFDVYTFIGYVLMFLMGLAALGGIVFTMRSAWLLSYKLFG